MADHLNVSGEALLYLYGVTQKPDSLPATLRGVDGIAHVQALPASGFVCWISRVSPVDFGDNLARNMENLEWLADASVRHQRVVGAIHERQEILPARFGTVFRNEQSLAHDLAGRKTALKGSFRRIADSDEWGVRVFAVPKPVAAPSEARSGKDYLQRKAAQLQVKPARTLEPEVREFAAAVSKLASATAEAGKVSSGQPGLRWQTSLLLPRARRESLQALLERFAEECKDRFRVECTGPWPPYSFVTDQAQARPSAPTGVARP